MHREPHVVYVQLYSGPGPVWGPGGVYQCINESYSVMYYVCLELIVYVYYVHITLPPTS